MPENPGNTELSNFPFREEDEFGGKEAIILAGGLGTRLRSAVPDLPKCMAPVAGKPFLFHLIGFLLEQGVERFIFSLGYMNEVIRESLLKNHPLLDYQLSIEEEPLGTGGAIRLALVKSSARNVLVVNGDTMFKINTNQLLAIHHAHNAACTLALKPMEKFDRYGVVEIDKDGHIHSFREKKYYESGLINGGVYALNVSWFLSLKLPEKFSFEKDYLEQHYQTEKMIGIIQDEYFVDIGIPSDLARADLQFRK